MEAVISNLVAQFEAGRLTRRQLVARLSGAALAVAGAGQAATAAEGKPTFQALGLNHIALRVPNVPRSREFYKKHLGLTVRRDGGERNCFLTCGDQFVALFRSDQPRMDHYCYSVKDYNQKEAAAKLKAQGLEPEMPRGTDRIYFKDPDGLKVQLAAADHRP